MAKAKTRRARAPKLAVFKILPAKVRNKGEKNWRSKWFFRIERGSNIVLSSETYASKSSCRRSMNALYAAFGMGHFKFET